MGHSIRRPGELGLERSAFLAGDFFYLAPRAQVLGRQLAGVLGYIAGAIYRLPDDAPVQAGLLARVCLHLGVEHLRQGIWQGLGRVRHVRSAHVAGLSAERSFALRQVLLDLRPGLAGQVPFELRARHLAQDFLKQVIPARVVAALLATIASARIVATAPDALAYVIALGRPDARTIAGVAESNRWLALADIHSVLALASGPRTRAARVDVTRSYALL